jgi:GNAT superfamily N-acetyltransferase
MEITVKALSPALIEDYFGFFDTVAFSDHDEWAGCYCMFYHTDPDHDSTANTGAWDIAVRKARAERMIWDGELTGYLAYESDRVVGWCNAGDKKSFCRLRANEKLWFDVEKAKAVVCFLIAPDMRGKGVAKQLLRRVCDDAAAQGYAFVESYPFNGKLDNFKHYHGHPAMYEEAGFETVREFKDFSVVRKAVG